MKSHKFKVLFTLFLLAAFITVGCGKKTDAPKTDTKTQTTDKKDDKKTDDKKKKEIKKSDAPKKEIKADVPSDWTELVSSDGKFKFSAPSHWTITDDTPTKFTAMNEDKTMGVTFVIFANDKITADELLALALGDFDFDPSGEAFAYTEGNMEGYITVAKGPIGGTDMMMYVMSAIENGGKGNYILYSYTATSSWDKNNATLEKILYSAKLN